MGIGAADRREALKSLVAAPGTTLAAPPILLPPAPYFDLAGEEFGARMILTQGADGTEFCLRPDFTLPIAIDHIASGALTPAAYGYLGPVFRQRDEGPAEFDQGGIELLALPNADAALGTVLGFARAVLDLYGVAAPGLRMGDIDLFEAVLEACDMPEVWRPRIRARFGHRRALENLLDRLADPHGAQQGQASSDPQTLAERVAEMMVTHGLSPNEGRSPQEIAERYAEKQALEAARVSPETLDLLRAWLALSGPADVALDAAATLAQRHGIAIDDALQAARHKGARVAELLGTAPVFDAAFSPRLDYYTGLTFEVTGPSGVLVSGGQYDRLLERLGAKARIPAVGCAVWVDRLETDGGAP